MSFPRKIKTSEFTFGDNLHDMASYPTNIALFLDVSVQSKTLFDQLHCKSATMSMCFSFKRHTTFW